MDRFFFFSLFLPIFNLFLQPRILVNGHGKSLTGRFVQVTTRNIYIEKVLRYAVLYIVEAIIAKKIRRKKVESRSFHFFRVISHNITHSKESYSSQKASPSVFNLATAIISRIITRPTERNRAGFKSAQKGVKAGKTTPRPRHRPELYQSRPSIFCQRIMSGVLQRGARWNQGFVRLFHSPSRSTNRESPMK